MFSWPDCRLRQAAPVAQLDRASDFGSEGWGFKSLRARQPIQLAEDSTVCSAPSFNLSRVGDCRSIQDMSHQICY